MNVPKIPFLLCGLLAGLLLWPCMSWAQAEVSAVPSQFSPGARIRVVSEGLAASASYRLTLEQDRPGTADHVLANFTTTVGQTAVSSSPLIPVTPSGSYQIVLYRVSLQTTRLASTAVAVRAQPSVTLTPTSAARGKSVRVSVGNLTPGTLRILFAGETVLGPVTVSGTTWTGKFVVPRDRPPTVPSTTTVVVENRVGRNLAGRTTLNFAVLASNGLPPLSATVTQRPTGVVPMRLRSTISGSLRDDDGAAPSGRQSAYWRGPDGRVLPLDDGFSVDGSGVYRIDMRAPDSFLDGVMLRGRQQGQLMIVNQGLDVHTDAPRTSRVEPGASGGLEFQSSSLQSQLSLFTVEVRRFDPANNNPVVPNAIVEIGADYREAFGSTQARRSGNGQSFEPVDNETVLGARRPNQTAALRNFERLPGVNLPDGYGCEAVFYRKRTGANGRATFNVNAEVLRQLTRPVPPDYDPEQGFQGGSLGGSVLINVYGAQVGLVTTPFAIGYDAATGTWSDADGNPFPNNIVAVQLSPGVPSIAETLRNMTIDGLGGTKRYANGNGFDTEYRPSWFGQMYTYPSSAEFPDSVFNPRNVGRKMRLTIPTGIFGPLNLGRIRIENGPWISFAPSPGTPACLLDSVVDDGFGNLATVEYVANLPDLTRLPARAVTTSNGIASGGVDATLELRFGLQPTNVIPLKFSTLKPPQGIAANNPKIRTLFVDGLNDRVTGDHVMPTVNIAVPPPSGDLGLGRLDNQSRNESAFSFQRTPDQMATRFIAATSDTTVAAIPGGTEGPSGLTTYFGFTNNNNPTTPDEITLFDTGLIPLFRYTWGIPPIADITMGADFWLASYLKYYGELKTSGMDATVDPTVAGGVNLFFDLDVLLGLASASIAAETEIAVTMRSVINAGGLPNQQSGRCFAFDLTAVWEACAVGFCDGGREPLIREREPNGCSTQVPLSPLDPNLNSLASTNGLDLARPKLTTAQLASDGRGKSITVAIDDAGDLVATHLAGTDVLFTRTIATRPVAPQHLSIAFYRKDAAMVVWSANRRTESQVRALMQQQGGAAFDDIVRTQVLYYARWNGLLWSEPQQLTTIGNDGKVQLAGCMPPALGAIVQDPCPSSGEITAVWERDANADLDAPDLEVWSARWQPGSGWTTPLRVSATGSSSDMLPSVAYKGTTPMVVWAHNPAGQFTNLQNRQVAYRFLDGSSAQRIATGLGTGIGWVSLGVNAADEAVIAFTRAQDARGFVGNRQALFAAKSILCLSGACTFDVTEPRDQHGRQFRVERPKVAFDGDGVAIIGFRAVAYGANEQGEISLAGDPIGITTGTGELGMVRLDDFKQQQHRVRLIPLTRDGLQHWSPTVVFDPAIGGVLALSGVAPAPVGRSEALDIARALAGDEPGLAAVRTLPGGSALAMLGGSPDFILENLSTPPRVIAAGQNLLLRARLVNQGGAFDSVEHGTVRVVAAWDAPPGAGSTASTFVLNGLLPTNGERSFSLSLTAPTDTRSDERRSLFIAIVAEDGANEIEGGQDRIRVDFNAMPVPIGVDAQANQSKLVSITWEDPNDPRIAGWRVWKLDGNGQWRHLGSSPVAGYMDFDGPVGGIATYRVASYSRNGIESEPSAEASIRIEAPPQAEGVFADSFEAP